MLYEATIAEGFEGDPPYKRLAKIYSQREVLNDEVRVLKKAITVFEKSTRSDAP